MRSGLLAFVQHRKGDLAQFFRRRGVGLEQLSKPDRAGQSAGAGTDHEHANLNAGIRRIGWLCDKLAGLIGRGKVRGPHHQPVPRCRRSSMTSGTMVCTSPITPRSLNSKMGAAASVLMATITFEFCIPTLCCTAPEIPRAT